MEDPATPDPLEPLAQQVPLDPRDPLDPKETTADLETVELMDVPETMAHLVMLERMAHLDVQAMAKAHLETPDELDQRVHPEMPERMERLVAVRTDPEVPRVIEERMDKMEALVAMATMDRRDPRAHLALAPALAALAHTNLQDWAKEGDVGDTLKNGSSANCCSGIALDVFYVVTRNEVTWHMFYSLPLL